MLDEGTARRRKSKDDNITNPQAYLNGGNIVPDLYSISKWSVSTLCEKFRKGILLVNVTVREAVFYRNVVPLDGKYVVAES